ncbi:hypothetical protein AVEN_203579-1 [Araneus ventricosus]|uniref:Uncharacterized protein n=1 Tax=Araneus ventricosus TaxID=182803 RepID=A0A4Y2EMA2_ARAVE|nr:hypothetical protein AVEN_203579-1 [Araneus ventricosus]
MQQAYIYGGSSVGSLTWYRPARKPKPCKQVIVVRFNERHLTLGLKPRSGRPESGKLEELKGDVEENSTTTTQNFMGKLGYSKDSWISSNT